MTRGRKGSGINGDLEPAEIAERDLMWLEFKAGRVLSEMMRHSEHGEVDEEITTFLRGIARTANGVALYYEKQLGLPIERGRRAAIRG